MTNKKVTERLRCNLTDEEELIAGRQLADATTQLKELEEEKTQVVSEFKARTTAQEAIIAVLLNKLRSGYEFRDVQCEIHFDRPQPGEKQLIRLDSNEVVRTESMSDDEKQTQLELN